MHKKNTQRWSKLFSTAGILTVLFGGLFAQSVRAVISNPTPICVGTTCTLTFDSTGDYYLWTPPSGARNISFDLMGGQGGRTGGLGGRVQGSLASVPAALYIYVGGAGATGAGAAGGFNGGGAAGGSRGDEGSGGGATDIRSATSINDRIAVAAGGGGTGGFFGGAGGAGGGQTGTAGTSGQGQGGQPGTPSSGGNGGSPNGGTWGTAGGLGIGGTGGTSSTSGGGGGGGGYYGGGGGGADVDGCCTNGGGGGGGSSWNSPTLTTAVTHTAGYRSGAGVATISYMLPPSVTTFAPSSTLTNSSSISYNLMFNESVTGLSNIDFVTTGSTSACGAIAVTGSGSSYLVTATGCGDGTLKMKLLANSITGTVGGPAADALAADVLIDRTVPTVIVSAPASPSSLLTLEYGFLFSESVIGLAVSDFIVTGTSCEVSAVSGSVLRYTVQVIRCADGVNTSITLAANSVSDVAANLGPATAAASTTVTVDRGTLVVATPTPTATPTPAASSSASPTPSQNSAPAQGSNPAPVSTGSNGDGPASGSGSGSGGATASLNQVSSLEIVAAQPVRKTYAFSSAIKLPTSPTEEPIAIYEPNSPQITIDNPTDDPPVAAKENWQQYAIIGVGSLSGLLATIGITKGWRQMRTRRLVRKFA